MKKLIVTTVVFLCAIAGVQAQTGFFNSTKVLEKMSQYNSAQQQLDKMKSDYEAKVKAEMDKIESLFNKYQSQKGKMNDNQRRDREEEIIQKEREVKEMKESLFGQDGALAKKSKELMDPIMQRLQSAIESVSKQYGMVLVFDIATTNGIVYYDESKDLTPVVMKKLNLK